MEDQTIVGIDIGTTKICTLVARVEEDGQLRIMGVGIEPSRGMKRGVMVDLENATIAIARSVEKAQRSSGYEIRSAWVSLAGSHVSSINSRGTAGVTGGIVRQSDVNRALEAAQSVAIPHNREVIHVIQRGFNVDGQDGISQPVGMHGYRLDVEAHIITAAETTVENIRKATEAAGVQVLQFVLNPLASGEVILTETERQLGVMVCDIGGGTTDLAIYINGDVWHTMVLSVGGSLITSDIAHGLRLSLTQAEEVKKKYGHAIRDEVGSEELFSVRSFGSDNPIQMNRKDLAFIIEARAEEIFRFVLQEVKRSGYDGLLPAGVVLTGGSSLLPGIRTLASDVLGLPVRISQPENLLGLVDQLYSPAYSTSVGLLYWALLVDEALTPKVVKTPPIPNDLWDRIKDFANRLLP
ncbi:cell division protein FtsA [Pelolinea submarina]|uniref:Cell division protein FtsA n=1 Tax=Pelolinea submarina TaxID=913107 RepID=A0A347ZS20_9CHLR|nr:cell division protein FtsA [Pelolinea submarina]REG11334.1 cell division protein FtsA [Pelolinea submarina]BBB48101.1 cell division protein FtsA [Pelolinea submarina]